MVMRFRSAAQRRFTLLPITFAALAMAACSHRQDADPEYITSIKDQPSASAFEPARTYAAPLPRSVPMPRQRLGGDTHVSKSYRAPVKTTAAAENGVTIAAKSKMMIEPKVAVLPAPKLDQIPADKSVAKDVAPKVINAAPKMDAVPLPPTNAPPPIVPRAEAPVTSPPSPAVPKVAAVPAPAPAPAVVPKVELIPAPTPGTPAAAASPVITPPAEIARPPAKVAAAQPPVIVAPKAVGKAPETPLPKVAPQPAPPASTKVTSLSEQTRVKDALDRADQFLKTGQVTNARALLQEAARGENVDLLTALAASYDPIVLKDYPSSAKSADSKRAAELYEVAIGKGSVAAKDRLARLKEMTSKPQ